MGGMPASRDSWYRDRRVSEEEFERRWNLAFGKKPQPKGESDAEAVGFPRREDKQE